MKLIYDYNKTMAKNWRGENNPRWNGGKRTLVTGYIMLKADSRYHSVNKDGYILEHRLVMEKHLGRKLTRREIVHHKNHIVNDNRFANLQLLSSQGEHIKNHKPHTYYKRPRLFTSCVDCGRTNVKNSTIYLCHACYMRKWNLKKHVSP